MSHSSYRSSKFPLAAISRLRMMTDGEGITTLVTACGCPLRCRMCINPETWNGKVSPRLITPEELYAAVKVDGLYFISTGGGVTFGGGEPQLHSEFIREFREIIPAEWAINAETCLNIPVECVSTAAKGVGHFYVDIKDTNPAIYRAYTGREVQPALDNLRLLLELAGAERVTVRLPLIKGFNTGYDVDKSERFLSDMGVTLFDRFEYIDKGKVKPDEESKSYP